MLTCFMCNKDVSSDIKGLYRHFKDVHSLIGRSAKYVCCQGQCFRSFTDRYVFGRHLEQQHSDQLSKAANRTSATECSDLSKHTEIMDADEEMPVDEAPAIHQSKSSKIVFQQMASKYIAECKSKTTTLANAQQMVNVCSSLIEFIVDDLASCLDSIDELTMISEDKLCLLREKLSNYRRPFDGLESDYAQSKMLEKAGYLIPPQTYSIGSSVVNEFQPDTGFSVPQMHSCTGQYISLEKTIQALHANTNLINEVLKTDTRPNNGDCLHSFFDGSHWKKHPSNCETVILVRLYGDDFEPGNPLGSHKTLYKIGTIYYQFENLPVALQSKLENIFLALCYYTEDVKSFGWQQVLQPLIQELKFLESEGVPLLINGEMKKVRIIVSGITGDNLFLNGILGFTECFSAKFPCRHCVISRDDFQSTFTEKIQLVRTREAYNVACTLGRVDLTGVKFASPLNSLMYFHAAENYIQDVQHDCLEGLCKYDMKLVVGSLLQSDYFTLEKFNGLVQAFSYGLHDLKNRPGVLTENALRADMLSFQAAETWCFTRVVSLAVGKLVPQEDNAWLFYLKLRNILDIVFAPSIMLDELAHLEVLIEEYLQMRNEIFPGHTLKNKHHHLVHYPRLIKEVGPLTRFWCMRFEAKHQRAKRIMQMSGCFKNVPLTIANRHQHDLAFRMLCGRDPQLDVILGRGYVVCLSEISSGQEINFAMGNIGLHFELFQCCSIEICGISYKPGCYIVIGTGEKPVFAMVQNIFARDQGEKIWFICDKLHTEDFDEHLHAWKVTRHYAASFVSIDPRSLTYPLPVSVHHVDDSMYIAGIRYRI